MCRARVEFAPAIMPNVALSTWLIVFARGRIVAGPEGPDVDDLRTLTGPLVAALLALSLRAFCLDVGVVVICSFC